MDRVCGKFNIVTELTNKTHGSISFDSNPGNFFIPGLPSFGSTTLVNLHDLNAFFSRYPYSRIRVYLDGKLTTIRLKPRHLLKDYVRIVFELDLTIFERKTCLVAKGLVEHKGDFLARLRCMGTKRSGIYAKREATYGLEVFRKAIVADETEVPDERQEHILEAVDEEVTDDSVVDDPILGLTSSEQVMEAVYPTTRSLTYFKPSMSNGSIMVGEISDHDVDKDQIRIWNSSLIGYIGDEIPMEQIKESWKEFEPFEIQVVADGFIAAKFTSDENMRFKVLEQGQWFINNKPLVLKTWSPGIVYDPRCFLAKIPLWIRLRGLNEASRTRGFLSRVCSIIGEPLFIDESNSDRGSSGFARVFVEVDASEELKELVHFSWNGNVTHVFVEYEWKPALCSRCFLGSQLFNMIKASPPELELELELERERELEQPKDMKNKKISWPVKYRDPSWFVRVGKYVLLLMVAIIAWEMFPLAIPWTVAANLLMVYQKVMRRRSLVKG